jgi:multidrug efflux system outer membrane protein
VALPVLADRKKVRMKIPLLIAACLLVAGCATGMPPASVTPTLASQWKEPLPPVPHGGTLADLSRWWQQYDDPLLVRLIDAAQEASPTLASARSQLEQARATRAAAGAALLPSLDASASVSRGFSEQTLSTATTMQGALQASWEIDLFGGNRARRDAAQARFEGAQAQWHDARVSVAAEVAHQYFALRSCRDLLEVTRQDATSRAETARLSGLSANAGFTAPATAALARASSAEAAGRLTQQGALCDVDVKVLVALTAIDEDELRRALDTTPANKADPAAIRVPAVPAGLLTQRPDLHSAALQVASASAEVGGAQAARYPRLTLNGSVGTLAFRTGGATTDFNTWSIGPLALSVPLFDGGRRAADVDAAKARYEEAAALYRARARQAVSEVEQALVNLAATQARGVNARTAVDGYRASFKATEDRYRGGLASLVELEDARRTALAAETNLVTLERERKAAWIALYRAVGGGWSVAEPVAARNPS